MLYSNQLLILVIILYQSISTSVDEIDTRIYQEVKNSIQIKSLEDFQEYISRNDITFMAYFYSKNNTLSKTGAYFLYKLDNQLDYLGKILFIDCDNIVQREKIKDCNIKEKNEILLPRIKIFTPPKEKYNQITNKISTHKESYYQEKNVSSESLLKSIVSNLIAHYQTIDSKNISSFLQTPILNKVILFRKSIDKDYENLLKGLSNIYYDRILIGVCTDAELASKYNIALDSSPKAISFKNSFFKKELPESSINNEDISKAEGLIDVFNKSALKEKYYLRRLIELTLEEIKVFPLYSNTYHIFMDKFKDKNKVIIFENISKKSNQINNLYDEQGINYIVNKLNSLVIFAKINCKIYESICSDYFNIIFDSNSNNNIILKFYPNTDDIHSSLASSYYLNNKNIISLLNSLNFKSNTRVISSSELSKEIFTSRNENKYTSLFLYNSKTTNSTEDLLTFKYFSSQDEYSSKVDFITIQDPSENLLKSLKVKSLPANLLIYHNKIAEEGFKQQALYKITSIEMRRLLEKFVNDLDFPEDLLKSFKFPIEIMDDSFYLLSKCIYSGRNCNILLVNGEYDDKINYINTDYFKIVDAANNSTSITSLQAYSSYFVVNATCHLEILKSFQVQLSELPTYIRYNGNYEQMFKKENITPNELYGLVDLSDNKISQKLTLSKKSIEVSRVNCNILTHRDFNKKFDFGGKQFEENDTDDGMIDEEILKEGQNLSKDYSIKYDKISKQKKDL